MAQPRPSTQALLTIRTAFDRFAEIVSLEDSRDFERTDLKDVRDAAIKIEQELAARRSLRNLARLQPFFRALEHYSKAVDVLCNGTPFLPWAWAPVKLMLRISSDFMGAFEKLIEAYEKIAHNLPRFDRLGAALKHDHDFQAALALVYADILEFHRRAYKFVRRRSWNLFFGSMWGQFESRFNSILASLARHSELVDKEAMAVDISEAMERRQRDAEQWEKQELEWRATKLRAVMSWLGFNGRAPEDELDKLLQGCLPDSCDWLVDHAKTQLWSKDSPTNALMWLHGKPGSGKSVLCANLVQSLEMRHVAVFFFFCSYLGAAADVSIALLRSFAAQAVQKNPDLALCIHDEIMPTYPLASRRALMALLPKILQSVGSVRLVVDGLDEWDSQEQKLALCDILRLLSTNPATYVCKLLISSRDVPTISRALRGTKKTLASISLSDEARLMGQAIERYVDKRITEYSAHLRELDPDALLLPEIRQMLVNKANGMFLWVRLVLDSLEFVFSARDLRETIASLPSDLSNLYNRILERICDPREMRKFQKANSILKWICFSRRPLHKFELLHAVSLAPENMVLEDCETPIADVLDLCKPLIEERSNGCVAFVHFSVQEFLFSNNSRIIRPADAQYELSFACTTLLTGALRLIDPELGTGNRLVQVSSGFYRLLPYALEFWIEHFLQYASNSCHIEEDQPIVRHLSTLRSKHDQILQIISKPESKLLDEAIPNDTLDERLCLVSHVSIYGLIREVLSLRRNIRQMKFENGTAVDEYAFCKDVTLFSTLAREFENSVLFLLSQDSVDGISKERLDKFRASYASTAFRCRYPSCPGRSIGFASAQLRKEHEKIHWERIFCRVSTCPWNRIGFNNKASLNSHIRDHHSKKIKVPVLTKSSDGTELSLNGSRFSVDDGRPPVFTGFTGSNDEFDEKLRKAGNRLATLFLDKVSPKFVREGSGWFAFFDPRSHRSLDVDCIATFQCKSVVCACRLSSDGQYLAIGCNRQSLVFNVHKAELCATLDHGEGLDHDEDMYIRSVAFIGDNNSVATGCEDKSIWAWDMRKQEKLYKLTGHEQDIYAIDVSRDGLLFVSGCGDRTVRVWNSAERSQILRWGIDDGITSVAFSPDKSLVVAASLNCKVYVWSIQTSGLVARLEGHKDSCYSCTFSPAGDRIISASLDKTVKIWKLDSRVGSLESEGSFGGRCIRTLKGPVNFVLSCAMTPDGGWVLSVSKDRTVHCWDATTGALQFILVAHTKSVISVSCNAAGTMFATTSGDMTAKVWSLTPYTGPR